MEYSGLLSSLILKYCILSVVSQIFNVRKLDFGFLYVSMYTHKSGSSFLCLPFFKCTFFLRTYVLSEFRFGIFGDVYSFRNHPICTQSTLECVYCGTVRHQKTIQYIVGVHNFNKRCFKYTLIACTCRTYINNIYICIIYSKLSSYLALRNI